jgi:hypothetical protein
MNGYNMSAGSNKIAPSWSKSYASFLRTVTKYSFVWKGYLEGLLIGFIRLYQWILSPYLGGHCRFEPSCSHYAIESLKVHGLKGLVLAIKRIAKCHPWGPYGLDPVPQKRTN